MSSHGIAETKDVKSDLVIIGGGGAGLAAAVAAAEKGASVIVLEKLGVGGNTALSSGLFGAESPVQKRAMIDCRKDDCFKLAMGYAHWRTNPRIVRAFIDRSGDTIRWLEEKGLNFQCVPLYPNQSPLFWHVAKGGGAEMIKVLAEECKKLGAQLLIRTSAKKILTGNKGNVTGVLAETKGEDFTITTKGVIIATGGYGSNKELLKKYCPNYSDNVDYGGIPLTGDGLIMATEIGAATEGLGLLMMAGPIVPWSALMNIGSPPNTIRIPLMAVALEPNTVWVNKKGQRFVDEAASYNHFECSNAVIRQPDGACFVLLDHKIVQTMTEQGLIIGIGTNAAEQRTKIPGLETGLQVQVDRGWVRISNFWDEIANWAGADRKVLKATIDEYNAACDHGCDSIFAKDRKYLLPLRTPPYYAIKGGSGFIDTIGGIKINEYMEVLDNQDNPISGLYAAGVVAGGWQGDTYCALTTGAASGFAVNSGRIAAENAVEFVLGSK